MIKLKTDCKHGKINIKDLFEVMVGAAMYRTHCLDEGDYVLVPSPRELDESYVGLERVSRLNYPESGDFETTRGTTGPIEGNFFFKIQKKRPSVMIIVGDRVTRDHEVCRILDEYVKVRTGQI